MEKFILLTRSADNSKVIIPISQIIFIEGVLREEKNDACVVTTADYKEIMVKETYSDIWQYLKEINQ